MKCLVFMIGLFVGIAIGLLVEVVPKDSLTEGKISRIGNDAIRYYKETGQVPESLYSLAAFACAEYDDYAKDACGNHVSYSATSNGCILISSKVNSSGIHHVIYKAIDILDTIDFWEDMLNHEGNR